MISNVGEIQDILGDVLSGKLLVCYSVDINLIHTRLR